MSLFLAAVVPGAFALGGVSGDAAHAAPLGPALFRPPSGNIACGYYRPTLRCDVLSGLVPEPRGACELDWTGVSVGVMADVLTPVASAGDARWYSRRVPRLEPERRCS